MIGSTLKHSRKRARRGGKAAKRGLAAAGLATGILVAASASGGASTLTSVWHYNASAYGVSSTFAPLGVAKLDVPARPSVAVSENNGSSSSATDTLATLTVPATNPALTASTLRVLASGSIVGATPNATAESTVENLNLALSPIPTLGASAVKSSCSSTKAGTVGSTSIVGGTGALSAVALNPPPNTTIPLGVVTIVLNEQTIAPDVATGIFPAFEHDIRVRAIHIIGNAPFAAGDIVVAESRCRLRGPGTA